MEVVINPSYRHLETFVRQIPSRFQDEGNLKYEGRNILKTFQADGLTLNVKRYRIPIFFNRVVYSFFRETKAHKAYRNALEMIARGFETPVPVAYVLEKRGGLLRYSYFVSIHQEGMREVRDYFFSKALPEDLPLLHAFAAYTASLHEADILHKDYSPGNILFRQHEARHFHFSLVDINRMEFRKVGMKKGCENFCRLFEYDEAVATVAAEYAQRRGFDKAACVEAANEHKNRFLKKDRRKACFKKIVSSR